MNKLKRILSMIYRFFYPLEMVDMYKRMGVEIGENCKFQFGVTIDFSHYWLIKIGNNVTLAPRVHVLAHDASTKNELNYTKIGLVEIGNNVFIGAGSIILPGVTVGNNSVIGAGSIVSKNIPENSVAAGNPCKVISEKGSYIERQRKLMVTDNCFDESYTLRQDITIEKKLKMIEMLKKHKIGFVE